MRSFVIVLAAANVLAVLLMARSMLRMRRRVRALLDAVDAEMVVLQAEEVLQLATVRRLVAEASHLRAVLARLVVDQTSGGNVALADLPARPDSDLRRCRWPTIPPRRGRRPTRARVWCPSVLPRRRDHP